MNALVGIRATHAWAEEQARWRDYCLRRLAERLRWAIAYVRLNRQRPTHLAVHHRDSLLTLVGQARAYPHLHSSMVELIAALGPWPARWGYGHTWEELLRFGLAVTDAHRDAAHRAALLDELAHLLLDAGQLEQALGMGQQAINQAVVASALGPLARASGLVANILLRQGKTEAAHDLLKQIEPRLKFGAGAGSDMAHFYWSHVWLSRRQGNLGAALAWADRAVTLLDQFQAADSNLLGDAHNVRGVIHWARGDYTAAASDINRAVTHYASMGDHYTEAVARGNLGLLYWSMGELDRAEACFRHIISITQQWGAQLMLATSVGNLGLVYLSRGKLDKALAYIEQHLQMATQIGDVRETMRARGNRGIALLHLQNLTAAMTDLEADQAFCQEHGSTEGLICDRVNYVRCLAGLDRREEALALAQETLSMAKETSSTPLRVIALRSLAEQSPIEQREALLQDALNLSRQMGRQLDEAACLLSIAVLKSGKEQTTLWQQGTCLLKRMGAAAWRKGRSPQNPPRILMMA